MNLLQILATHPRVPKLGSTLIHFLWQGVAIAAVYAVASRPNLCWVGAPLPSG